MRLAGFEIDLLANKASHRYAVYMAPIVMRDVHLRVNDKVTAQLADMLVHALLGRLHQFDNFIRVPAMPDCRTNGTKRTVLVYPINNDNR
jgi:hypothetical protein